MVDGREAWDRRGVHVVVHRGGFTDAGRRWIEGHVLTCHGIGAMQ